MIMRNILVIYNEVTVIAVNGIRLFALEKLGLCTDPL